jgi:ribosomal protein S18 acetylase RimI-like enzyme
MNTDYEIRLARISDAKTIAEMSRDLIEQGLVWSWQTRRVQAMIAHPESVVTVAEVQNEIAGFAVMEFHEEHAHLNLLAVTPRHRRLQVGSALLRWLEKSAQIAGIARIILEVRSTNQGALDFYKIHDYHVDRKIRGYYQGKESALRMVHTLISPEIADLRP